MILSVTKKTGSRWRELGSLVAVVVGLHVPPVGLNASRNRVPRPLRAGRESAFAGSVCQKLDSLPSLPVLHPLEVPSKVQDGCLETPHNVGCVVGKSVFFSERKDVKENYNHNRNDDIDLVNFHKNNGDDEDLEALLSQLLVVLAKSVTVSSPVVGNYPPTHLFCEENCYL